MKVRLFGIFITALCWLGATVSSAQTLPLLPQDPAVRTSVFPNGLSCYVAENKSSKGFADFALIKRDYDGNELICAQKNVVLSSEEAVDSLLLGMMRRVEKDRNSSDCALVISGDVNADVLMTKLKYMSLMVDPSETSLMPEYTWNGDTKVVESMVTDSLRGLSTIRFQWHSPSTPAEYLKTTQAAVYRKTVYELGKVAALMIERNLRRLDIPVADISYRHDDGSGVRPYEEFSLEVTVGVGDAGSAGKVASSSLAHISKGKVDLNDYLLAERDYVMMLEKSSGRAVVSNEEYLSMCRDAFLFNRSLSSDKEHLNYLSSKDVPDATRRDMFSSVASALLDAESLDDTFSLASSGVMLSDTLGLPGPSLTKTKIRSSRKDAFTGGHIWTFANGFKVIYRKMPSTGRKLYYSMSLNGGYGNVESLRRGEGSYLSDYFKCCWIAGMKASDFNEMLALAGVKMDLRSTLFHTFITGEVEDRNAALMMRSLLAVSNHSRLDSAQVEYFCRSEQMRREHIGGPDLKSVVDSMICPGYRYTPFKSSNCAQKETFAKAKAIFTAMTSKMNDGILVIVGDMPETELKQQLQLYAGSFKVKTVASRRPSLQYHPVSGWLSYTEEGTDDLAAVILTTPLAMTAANHFAAEIAALILEHRLKHVFEPKDMPIRVSYARDIYPDERFSVMVEISGKCDYEDMALLKAVLSDCRTDITAAELTSCKEFVKNSYALQSQTPDYWLRVIPLRHLEGKDFTTGAAAKIDAVSLEGVQKVFKALEEGAGIDYITKKK